MLGFIFGLVGLSRSRRLPRRTHHGLAIAAIVVRVVAVALGVAGAYVTTKVLDDFEDDVYDMFGSADPLSYELGAVECAATGSGPATARGSITNTTAYTRGFGIVVEFTTPDGSVRESRTFVSGTPPGGTSDWQVESVFDLPAGTDCRVVDVTNF